jgi:hypothetical protein
LNSSWSFRLEKKINEIKCLLWFFAGEGLKFVYLRKNELDKLTFFTNILIFSFVKFLKINLIFLHNKTSLESKNGKRLLIFR